MSGSRVDGTHSDSLVNELASETLDWMAEDEPNRPDVSDKVWAYCLATFVDGVAISPMGYDETWVFEEVYLDS